MDRRIRKYLDGIFTRNENDGLPSRIAFSHNPADLREARLQGVLEALYVSGKISAAELTRWAIKLDRVDVGSLVDRQPAPRVDDEWADRARLASAELRATAETVTFGSIVPVLAELFSVGLSVVLTMKLNEKGKKAYQDARKDLRRLSPDLVAFHIAQTLVPTSIDLTVSDDRGKTLALSDSEAHMSDESTVVITMRFTPAPAPRRRVTIFWAGQPLDVALQQR